ncbi:synaptogyrin 3 [Phyllostomus discolor]|uniref:Synaptogyrin 3 n=1 Tax=Phyllostomus discolor TaxID=89673 RepID=A0A834BDT9_9CHIR|nr:synaptogyrin 3 [Phyllostomus discolor]
MEGGSFGAGRAGSALDPVSFAKRPQTVLRVVSWVFSIAVFGPIVNEGYVNSESGPELRCVFNGNAGACRFGVTLGLGAFLACAAFLFLDLRFQQISSVRDRRRAVLLDLGFSGGCGRARRGNPGTERLGLPGGSGGGAGRLASDSQVGGIETGLGRASRGSETCSHLG